MLIRSFIILLLALSLHAQTRRVMPHKAQHSTGGADAIAPSDISAVAQSALQAGTTNYLRSTTGNDTYTGNLTPALTAYTRGGCIVLDADTANTGAATVNVDSLGAKSILNRAGSALANGDITANKPITICYDGTQFIIQGDGGAGAGEVSANEADTTTKENYLTLYTAVNNEIKASACRVVPSGESNYLTCSDGTKAAVLDLPELAANGSNSVWVAGAESQSADTCMVMPAAASTTGQVLRDSGSTTSIDPDGTGGVAARTCRILTWGSAGTDFSKPDTAETVTASRTIGSGGSMIANGADRTAPSKSGTSLPATCTVGDTYIKTDATATGQFHVCTATNTWTAQGGGGSGAVTCSRTTLSSAQILNLHNTAVTFLAAPGANKVNTTIHAQFRLNFNTTAYAAGSSLVLKYSGVGGTLLTYATIPNTLINGTASQSYFVTFTGMDAIAATTGTHNQPLVVYISGAAYTTGNSTLDIDTCYTQQSY